jgi:Na+-transporting NADH:ubiquinone oxidoreductase subunit NqrD
VSAYEDVEDLAIAISENRDAALNGFEYHFRLVRNAILRTLWANGVLIGISVVESLLFSAIADPRIADPTAEVFSV